MHKTSDIISELAEKYDVNIIQVVSGDEHCAANGTDNYINRSAVAGDTIWAGVYADENLKMASIFHEIGHKIVTQEFIRHVNYDSVAIEREIWRIGFKLAKECNIHFSGYVYRWAVKNIRTYKTG